MNKKLYVYSKSDFLEFVSKNNWLNKFPERTAVISICNVGESHNHIFDDTYENVLNVEFDDVSEKDPNFIDKETAKKIVEFINENISCDIYIHCDAGKSRSQAVARYIMDVYSHDWETRAENPCITPNIDIVCALKVVMYYEDIKIVFEAMDSKNNLYLM